MVPYHKTLPYLVKSYLTHHQVCLKVWRRFKYILRNVNKNVWTWITKKYDQRLICPSKEQPRQPICYEGRPGLSKQILWWWQVETKGPEAYKTCWLWRYCKTPQCEYHVVWTKEGLGKDAASICRLVYGKVQYENNLPTINVRLLGDHCFYIKKMDVHCKWWECKDCRQIFTRNEKLIRRLKEERCTGGKTKIICSGGKFKHILSHKKASYGGDTRFSYTACQWIEAQAIKRGKHIYNKMCGHGGERMVRRFGILMTTAKKTGAFDGYEPEPNTVYQFQGCHWHGHTCLKNRTKRQQKSQVDWLIKNNG